ncbi:MAG TPA: CDP-alcohol phosphatidyltransferase family protein [Caulobacteraceae bacterium]|nr:CDP-alcohol phosphatidyltransferase family protein [Caulobacteraceae bacterium]
MTEKASPDVVTGAPGRPVEIEEATNLYLIHPMSRRVVDVLQHTPVTPNQVSVASMLFAAAGAFCYARLAWPASAVVGLLLLIVWHVLDGADGDLARRTGRASPIGELVDGVCDHVSQGLVYIALAWMAQASLGVGTAWGLAVAAAASHFIQANAYETGRKTYRRWVYGAAWMRQTQDAGGNIFQALLGGLYVGISHLVAPGEAALEAAMGPRLAAGGERAAEARAIYRDRHAGLVKASSWLSSNNRTIAAFLAVLASQPSWFFLYELSVLNVALVAVLVARARRNAAVAKALA